eukprot:m51a1_g9821 hypothetical protein (2448) ;mRNA; f:1895526-1905660
MACICGSADAVRALARPPYSLAGQGRSALMGLQRALQSGSVEILDVLASPPWSMGRGHALDVLRSVVVWWTEGTAAALRRLRGPPYSIAWQDAVWASDLRYDAELVKLFAAVGPQQAMERSNGGSEGNELSETTSRAVAAGFQGDEDDEGPARSRRPPTARELRARAVAAAALCAALALGVAVAAVLASRGASEGTGADADGAGDEHEAGAAAGSPSALVAWLQTAAAVVGAVLTCACVALAAPVGQRHAAARLCACALLQVVCLGLDIAVIAYPQVARLVLAACAAGARAVALVAVAVAAAAVSSRPGRAEKRAARPAPRDLRSPQDAMQLLCRADDWADLQTARARMGRRMELGRMLFGGLCAILFALSVGNGAAEFAKIITTQSSLYPRDELRRLNDPARAEGYFGAQRQRGSHRVVLVVVDGLRYDFIDRNDDLRALISDPQWISDAKLFHMRAQLPSMSVPNWITLVTGTRPEINGVLGNLLVPETPYDSIFREAKVYGLGRGLTGSPWFADIVRSTLPWFKGDGTVPTTAEPTAPHSANGADLERFRIASYALNGTGVCADYELFLVHFSDVDAQGHCCGVDRRWNARDTYNGAVSNKTRLLRNLTALVDEGTVVVIVSDHGQVSRGGHGGVEESLMDVPVVVYKRGSNFSGSTFAHPGFRNSMAPEPPVDPRIQNVDVATTISALLGVPVPRQSEGVFIDEAMSLVDPQVLALYYKDLFVQKHALVSLFLETVARSASLPADPFPGNTVPNTTDEVLSSYVKAINKLQRVYDDARSRTIMLQQLRNVLLTLVLSIALWCALVALLHFFSFCDVISLLPRCLHPSSSTILEAELLPLSPSPELMSCAVRVGSQNVKACVEAFVVVCAHFAISIVLYVGVFAAVGYSTWDSTVIHTPEVVPRYFVVALVPGLVSCGLIAWAYHVAQSIVPIDTSSAAGFARSIARRALSGLSTRDLARIYLFRYYMLMWVCVATMTMFVVQGTYTFPVPDIFRMHFVTRYNWAMRFRLVTVQIMTAPLMALALATLYFFPRATQSRPDVLDPIFLLQVMKEKAHWAGAKVLGSPRKESAEGDQQQPQQPQQKPARTYHKLFLNSYAKAIARAGTFHHVAKLFQQGSFSPAPHSCPLLISSSDDDDPPAPRPLKRRRSAPAQLPPQKRETDETAAPEIVENGTETHKARGADPAGPEGTPRRYNPERYLENVELAVRSATSGSGAALFHVRELSVFADFAALPLGARRLFARLFPRKGPWFRVDRLAYAEVPDVAGAARDLADAGFATLDAAVTRQTLPSVLEHLLTEISKASARRASTGGAARSDLLAQLLEPSRQRQRTLTGSDQLCESVHRALGRSPLLRLDSAACAAFSRAVRLFFACAPSWQAGGGAGADEADDGVPSDGRMLNLLVAADLGHVRRAQFRVDENCKPFATRAEWDAYESSCELERALSECSAEPSALVPGTSACSSFVEALRRAAREVAELALAESDPFPRGCELEEPLRALERRALGWPSIAGQRSAPPDRPPALRRFSAGWPVVRCLWHAVATLGAASPPGRAGLQLTREAPPERLRWYADAVSALRLLLACDMRAQSRGEWWERLSVDLEHLGLRRAALAAAELSLADARVAELSGQRLALQRRVLKLARPPLRWRSPTFPCLRGPAVVRVARALAEPTGDAQRRCLFVSSGGGAVTVEEAALEHYREREGWQGVHSESAVFSALLGLLLWDELFADVPGAFVSPFQDAPLDFGTEGFYGARRAALESRLAQVEAAAPQELAGLVESSAREHRGVACAGVNWDRHPIEALPAIAASFGGRAISTILRLMSIDGCWRAGMPDLVLYRPEGPEPRAKLSEVKSPNDRHEPSEAWIHQLVTAGVHVDLCLIIVMTTDGKSLVIRAEASDTFRTLFRRISREDGAPAPWTYKLRPQGAMSYVCLPNVDMPLSACGVAELFRFHCFVPVGLWSTPEEIERRRVWWETTERAHSEEITRSRESLPAAEAPKALASPDKSKSKSDSVSSSASSSSAAAPAPAMPSSAAPECLPAQEEAAEGGVNVCELTNAVEEAARAVAAAEAHSAAVKRDHDTAAAEHQTAVTAEAEQRARFEELTRILDAEREKLERRRNEIAAAESRMRDVDARAAAAAEALEEARRRERAARDELDNAQSFAVAIERRSVAALTVTAVRKLLESLGLSRHAAAFARNAVSGEALTCITNAELCELGVSQLPERALLRHALALIDTCGIVSTTPAELETAAKRVPEAIKKDLEAALWKPEQVSAWLEGAGVGTASRAALVAAGVDGLQAMHLECSDLKELSLPISDRVQVLKNTSALREAFLRALAGSQRQPSDSESFSMEAEPAGHAPSTPQKSSCSIARRPPQELLCPITLEIMRHPVVAPDGYVYEESAIKRWISSKKTSPVTGAKMKKADLVPCNTIKDAIKAFMDPPSGSAQP